MTDVLTQEQRKYNMSRIRGKNTRPEVQFRRILFSHGIRGYRVHYNLPGKPDVVFLKKKIAIFIDGCFWHKCPICYHEPETRKEFWKSKIQSNIDRDKKNNELLRKEGWIVIRFWEHEVNKAEDEVIKKISSLLGKNVVKYD